MIGLKGDPNGLRGDLQRDNIPRTVINTRDYFKYKGNTINTQ